MNSSQQSRDHGTRILVVDDDKATRDAYVDILAEFCKEHGYKLVTASDGKKALEICQSKPMAFVLIITDNDMPFMTGRQLVDALKKGGEKAPVIMISGDSEAGFLQWTRQAGLSAFLPKPITYDRLVGAVEAVLGQH